MTIRTGKRFWLSVSLGAALVLTVIYLLLPAVLSGSAMDVSRVDEIPDYKQTDPSFGFPGKGLKFCAPVAVLDSFVYLSKHGYSSLLRPEDNGIAEACRNIAKCMQTGDAGTSTEQFLKGVDTYIKDHSPYKISALVYAGWNRHQKEFDCQKQIPDLRFIKDGINGTRSEWLNIGWYRYDAEHRAYLREEGHWVVLTGYGMNFSGAADENTLIVKDPNPVAGMSSRKVFISVHPLKDASLTGPHEGLPREAAGYLCIDSMSEVLDAQKRIGIIDGAVVLDLMPGYMRR